TTLDGDVAVPPKLKKEESTVRKRLLEAGFEEEFVGTEILLRPARSSGSPLCHSSRSPRSGDGLDLCSFEAMFSGPLLDLLGASRRSEASGPSR
ncbi:MAG: hypothetical protein DMG38_00400, partial [Acidobacteria bacterium]